MHRGEDPAGHLHRPPVIVALVEDREHRQPFRRKCVALRRSERPRHIALRERAPGAGGKHEGISPG